MRVDGRTWAVGPSFRLHQDSPSSETGGINRLLCGSARCCGDGQGKAGVASAVGAVVRSGTVRRLWVARRAVDAARAAEWWAAGGRGAMVRAIVRQRLVAGAAAFQKTRPPVVAGNCSVSAAN